jgi:hypothetical protein
MSDIKRLAKEDKNQHGGYNFASIDDFLDLTRPLCAKHGLVVLQDEEDFEVIDAGNNNKSLRMRFAFTLEAGGESRGPLRRSIMVPAKMGSQAFGAGQSYALKQFLRATFQIATGEKDDIDHHDTGELPVNRSTPISGKQADEIRALIESTGSDAERFLKYMKAESVPDILAADYNKAVSALNKKAQK